MHIKQLLLLETRNSLLSYLKTKFPTWPEYIVKDLVYNNVKPIHDTIDLEEYLDHINREYGRVKWKLEKIQITINVFTQDTQNIIISRNGGKANPNGVPKDAERHAQQLKMIKQHGVRDEPIIVIKRDTGYELIEGFHRTIQHLNEFPAGYIGPAWVGYEAD